MAIAVVILGVLDTVTEFICFKMTTALTISFALPHNRLAWLSVLISNN